VLPAKAHTTVVAGDVHVFLQTGGGGYGDPLRREPERVIHDVERGLLSHEAARSVYGLVRGGDGSGVDTVATESARDAIRASRLERCASPPAGGLVRVAGGELLHPVADTVEAVRADGEALLRCTVCLARLAVYGDDYKAGACVRELPLVELGELNAVAPVTDVVAREYCCPGCGTALAVDVQRAGEPRLPECTFDPNGAR
jgi:N-methylhydantoinase B